MRCGLLGRRLGHSYSPQIHAMLGNYPYELFEKEPHELENFLKDGDFTGLNVTVPYKKAVIPYLDVLTDQARKLGAVNTIVRRNGRLIGHNTDHFGFQTMLSESGLSVHGKKVLVLGSGGASNTAAAVLREAGARVVIISRSGEDHYGNLHRHTDASVIVNTTPVGMYPETGKTPLSLTGFNCLEGVLDVIYNPARTRLLLDAEEMGLITMNGLLMLVAQAKEAAEWFTQGPISDEKITHIYTCLRKDMENILLIGMPGCGKSTIGPLLAQSCGKAYADADSVIEQLAGKPIPQIFADDGEDRFRQWETQALELLGKRSSTVIATGGGCVTRAENYPHLHQNGTIVWLQRALEQLPTDGRPLSKSQALADMYRIREPLYQTFADLRIDNNGTPEETVAGILEVWK